MMAVRSLASLGVFLEPSPLLWKANIGSGRRVVLTMMASGSLGFVVDSSLLLWKTIMRFGCQAEVQPMHRRTVGLLNNSLGTEVQAGRGVH